MFLNHRSDNCFKKVRNDQVSDTTGDAMKYYSWNKKQKTKIEIRKF